ncbi:uncharacterized protein [Lepeophtheirus salmonis]|uniref:uncharacterized protein n=1 Tax=Lepeophtheirus salmonis TaxID=72036 RepID=UPI001AE638F3|nr:uncharacterized protein LOC121113665 [Lepeophtheirus salmonis]
MSCTIYQQKYPNTHSVIQSHEKVKIIDKVFIGDPKEVKSKGSQRLRWNLVFNICIWILITIPFWLPFVPKLNLSIVLYVLLGLQGAFSIFFLIVSLLALRALFVVFGYRNYDFTQDEDVKKMLPKLTHLVILSCYKEPIELISKTIQSVASQTMAKNVIMVVGFEEKTPDRLGKQIQIAEKFGNIFQDLISSVHPYGVEGEIPGKCSNSNCAIRTAVSHLQELQGSTFDAKNVIITNCDADSNFHPKYIEALSYKFVKEKNPTESVFQSPLLYNWNLDASSVITRVTGIIRSYLMMGAMIPFNINTMSIFSFSASLCIAGDYVHPGYQMDDIIALIRWMGVTKKTIKTVFVPVPVISGPTSGRTIEDEIEEWARQARRWTIGASEVFHYFVIKSRNIPFFTAITWGITFFIYYGIILCGSALYNVSLSLSLAFVFPGPLPEYVQYIMYGFGGLQYIVFFVVFVIDALILKTTKPRVHERISIIRNVVHWILSPLVLLLYSFVEFYAIHEVVFRGKKVCKHGASKKENLNV